MSNLSLALLTALSALVAMALGGLAAWISVNPNYSLLLAGRILTQALELVR